LLLVPKILAGRGLISGQQRPVFPSSSLQEFLYKQQEVNEIFSKLGL